MEEERSEVGCIANRDDCKGTKASPVCGRTLSLKSKPSSGR